MEVTHQVVRPALGSVLGIPLLILVVQWRAYARAISITIVLEISPVPTPSSDSELLQM